MSRTDPCRRTGCLDGLPHVGGEHLDPRSPWFDGPELAIGLLGSRPQRLVRALLDAGAPVPELVALAGELRRLDDLVVSTRINGERAARAASDRSLDCAEHGQMIRSAELQAHRFGVDARRHDEARGALLSALFGLKDAVAALRNQASRGEELPLAAEIVEVISGFLDKASKAHEAAWRRGGPRAGKNAEPPSLFEVSRGSRP